MLGGYRALSFDIVGTLIDYRAGALAWLRPRLEAAAVAAEAEAILQAFHEGENHEHASRPETPFTQTLPAVWDHVAAQFGVTPQPGDGEAFMASLAQWPAFADSREALGRLRERFLLAAVTNADRWGAEAMTATLEEPFDVLVSAEEAGAVKPDRRPFEAVWAEIAQHGISADEVAQVGQGQVTDIEPAHRFGQPAIWINRYASPRHGPEPDYEFPSLAGLAKAAGV